MSHYPWESRMRSFSNRTFLSLVVITFVVVANSPGHALFAQAQIAKPAAQIAEEISEGLVRKAEVTQKGVAVKVEANKAAVAQKDADDKKAAVKKDAAKKDAAKKAAEEAAEEVAAVEAGEEEAEGEHGEAAEDGDDKKKQANPLANFIKGIFRPGGGAVLKPKMPADPDEGKEVPANGLKTARDSIDERAPYIREQAGLLRSANTRISSGDWKGAIEILQRLLDSPENSVFREPDGEFISIRTEAHRLIGTAPAETLRQYRQEYGGLAKRMLDEAEELNDPQRTAAVVSRFFHTPAGYEAADKVGTMHLDRGEFVSASYWFSRLLETDAAVTSTEPWKAKASIAFKKVGQQKSKRVWGELATAENEIQPLIGGEKRSLQDWLTSVDERTPWNVAVQEDWNIMYGSPSRNTHAVGGEPLLIPRWAHGSTATNRILTQLENLVDDLTSSKRATIPAFVPITVDGKIVYRTFKGIAVVDVSTGKLLWESAEEFSPEQILTGSPVQPEVFTQNFVQVRSNYSQYSGGGSDSHPLTSLLYRNGNYGTVSSDGVRVYSVTHNALLSSNQPGYYYGFDPAQNDTLRRDWTSNRITAYDLKTGRVRWVIGGREMNEPFDPPLAGTFFFGAPVPADGLLYVIGEKSSEIRLIAIDPSTGEQAWSQLIAYAEAKIDKDLGRRWWTAQPAVGNGVIVCPTTVGWLVAVDRISHEVLWANRYSKPKKERRSYNRNRGVAMTSTGTLNSRWSPSAPIISGNRVVYTPTEEERLFCLNLITGEPEWADSRPRGDGLYPVGIFDDTIVLVGKDAVSAVSMKNGTVAWTHPYAGSDELGLPSGRAIIVDENLLLPFQSGQLWMMKLDQTPEQRKITKFFVNNDDLRLGNLLLYQGMLLSQTPFGITAYEQREAVEQEIARRIAADASDPWATLKRAEIEFSKREYDKTIGLVRQAPLESINDAELVKKRQHLLKSCLVAVVSNELTARDAEFAELGELVKDRPATDTDLYERLAGERFLARKKYEKAFTHFLEMAKAGSKSLVKAVRDDNLEIRTDIWLQRRLMHVWNLASDEMKQRFEAQIAEEINSGITNNDAKAIEFAIRTYRFHPLVGKAIAARAAIAGANDDYATAEAMYMELMRSGSESEAASATLELAKLLAKLGYQEDARHYYMQAQSRYGAVQLADRGTVSEITLKAMDDLSRRNLPTFLDAWQNLEFEVRRTGTNYQSNTVTPANVRWSDVPFWDKHRVAYSSQTKRLEIVDTEENRIWSLPLRSRNGFSQGQFVPVHPLGHRFIVLHQGALQCLSMPEKKVVWSHAVDLSTSSSAYMRTPSYQNQSQMPKARHASGSLSVTRNTNRDGLLAMSSSNVVCYHGRRRVIALDAHSGDVIWIRNRVPRNSVVFGDEQYMFIVPPDRNKSMCLKSIDGSSVEVKDLPTKLSKAIANIGHKLVTIENQTSTGLLGLSKPGTKITLLDPIKDKTAWKVSLNRESYISLIDGHKLVSVDPERNASLVDLVTGKQTKFGNIPESAMKSVTEMYSLDDKENVYLFINKRTRGYSSSYLSLRSIRMRNGSVVALNKDSGKVAWTWDVASKHKEVGKNFSTHLLLDHIDKSPLLLFASRRGIHKENVYYNLVSILAVDKKTGKVVLDHRAATNNSFRSVVFNMAEKYIDLSSYNERYRIQAIVQQAAVEDFPPPPDVPEGT